MLDATTNHVKLAGHRSEAPLVHVRLCARARRGPALGGVCLGKLTDSSETRVSVPIAARQSVHGMPLMVRALGGTRAEGTQLERRKKLQITSQERYTSASIWPFGVQAHADGRRDGVTEAFRSST